jgi:hypothetical protein
LEQAHNFGNAYQEQFFWKIILESSGEDATMQRPVETVPAQAYFKLARSRLVGRAISDGGISGEALEMRELIVACDSFDSVAQDTS